MSARELPLQPIINQLLEPVQSSDDPEQTKEILVEQRQALVDECLAMQQGRDNFNRDLREYEVAQGFTPVINWHSRVDEVRARGRDLNAELEKDNRTKANSAVSNVSARNKPKYSSPAKNLRAAAAVAKELHVLSGFIVREDLLLCSSYLPLGVPNWVPNTHYQAIFLAPLPGRKRISARGVSRFQSFSLLLFCFTLFLLASFYRKYKKKL
jgi:hypothetical protein